MTKENPLSVLIPAILGNASPEGLTKEELLDEIEAELGAPVSPGSLRLGELALAGKITMKIREETVTVKQRVKRYLLAK